MRKGWVVPVVPMVVACGALWGCSHVRVTQEDGCWVRDTWTFPSQVKQEVGPCSRAEPRWSEDRPTRLLQECLSASEHRWHDEAMVAWNKGTAFSAPASEEDARRACMSEAVTSVVHDNEVLQRRLAEVLAERDRLDRANQSDLTYLRSTHDRLTDALGEAAKKPAPAAFATATSAGTASSEAAQTRPPAAPRAPGAVAPEVPVAKPSLHRGCPLRAEKVVAEDVPPGPASAR